MLMIANPALVVTALMLVLGLLALRTLARTSGARAGGRGRGATPRVRLVPAMRDFGLRQSDFLNRLVLENSIQNVILYKFIDGFLEDRDLETPPPRADEARLERAARRALRDLLSDSMPAGASLAQVIDSWRRRQGGEPE